MALRDEYLADDFILAEATALNHGFASVGVPFYAVCGSRTLRGKLQLSYRRYDDGCTGFVNARYVSEKDVIKYLSRNKKPSLETLKKSTSMAVPEIKKICKINTKIVQTDEPQKFPNKPLNIENYKQNDSKNSQKKKEFIMYGDDCKIVTQSSTINGKYGIIEFKDLIASHTVPSFSVNSKYPVGCQERKYESDGSAQAEVKLHAKNFESQFLLSDNPSATDGAPIINNKGIVLGGNGRIMSLQIANSSYPGKMIEYQTLLSKKSGNFGFTKNDIWQFDKPVLVRVISIDIKECLTWSWKLNTDTKKEQTVESRAIAYSKELTQKDIDELAQLLQESEAESFANIKDDIKTVRELIKILRKAGIIVQTNQENWLSGPDSFSDNGLMYLETMLLAVVLKDKEILGYAKKYSQKIVKSLAYFLRLSKLKGKWNLLKYFQEALKAEQERQIKGLKKLDITRQKSAFDKDFDKTVGAAWDILDLPTNQFKKVMERITISAENESQADAGSAMFGEKIEPFDVMNSYAKKASTLEDKKHKKQSIFKRSKF